VSVSEEVAEHAAAGSAGLAGGDLADPGLDSPGSRLIRATANDGLCRTLTFISHRNVPSGGSGSIGRADDSSIRRKGETTRSAWTLELADVTRLILE
jgi:hypothetical protein